MDTGGLKTSGKEQSELDSNRSHSFRRSIRFPTFRSYTCKNSSSRIQGGVFFNFVRELFAKKLLYLLQSNWQGLFVRISTTF